MLERENLTQLKTVLFDVFAAGFEFGSETELDIVTAYNEYWKSIEEGLVFKC